MMAEHRSSEVKDPHTRLNVVDFDEFYRARRVEMARAVALAVGGRDLGCEAADEAFARALTRWGEVSGYDNPAGWVYRVAVNWGRSRLRRSRREASELFIDPLVEQEMPEPELLEAVKALPVKYRAVVVARFFLDWSIQQTAEALAIPEGTVKTRQGRAIERLRKRLKEPQ